MYEEVPYMKEGIFRKESLEKINSPGQLNRYIRVADSGTWLILAAIVVLLLGTIIWGIFGAVETTMDVQVAQAGDIYVCCMADADAGDVQPGMLVRAGDQEGEIIALLSAEEVQLLGLDAALLSGGTAYARAEFASLDAGVHEGEVVLERIAPISFVIQ